MADGKDLSPEELVRILNIIPERKAKVDALFAHGAKEEKLKKEKEEKVKKEKEERIKKEDARYCICRQSNTDRFMIGCDNCDEWFHGDCIGILQEEAQMIRHFYCKPCLESNPELSIKYKKKKTKAVPSDLQGKTVASLPPEEKILVHTDDDAEEQPKTQGGFKSRSSRMCGECVACRRTTDCAQCDFCKDMRKFGGPNKMRQKCRQRQCLKMSRVLLRKVKRGRDIAQGEEDDTYFKQPKQKDVMLKEKKKKAVKMKHATLSGRKEKVKPQLSDRPRRRRRIGSDEKKGGGDQPMDRVDDIPQQCYGPGCQHAARFGSKYCSDECGVQLAVRRIQEILPKRMKQWNREPCVADQNAQEALQEVAKKKQEAQNMLLELDKLSLALDSIIERGSRLTAVPAESQEADMDTDTDLQLHCVTCGLQLAPRVALRHMEKCYMKNESMTTFGSAYKSAGALFCDVYNAQQKIYCKRLRVLCPEHTKEPKIPPNAVCGCPLVSNVFEETDKICLAPKRNCMKHFKWEKLRRAEIDLQRVQQWLKLEEAFEQERAINHMTSQRGGVLGMLLHQTISPDWEEEEKAEEAAKIAEAASSEVEEGSGMSEDADMPPLSQGDDVAGEDNADDRLADERLTNPDDSSVDSPDDRLVAKSSDDVLITENEDAFIGEDIKEETRRDIHTKTSEAVDKPPS